MKLYFASHGGLAKGMKESLEMIVGTCDNLFTYCMYPGDNAIDFANNLLIEMQNNPEIYVVFVDLYGASVCNSLIPLLENDNFILVSGMNLGMVVDFFITINSLDEAITKDEVINQLKQSIANSEEYMQIVALNKLYQEDF